MIHVKAKRIEEDGFIYAELPPIVFRIPVLRVDDNLQALPSNVLTFKETQVFDLLRRGKPNKEIASALNLGERMVKFHVSSILRKLDCESRGEIIFKFRPNE